MNNFTDSENLKIEYNWPEWFGKLKLVVGAYAEGYSKMGLANKTQKNSNPSGQTSFNETIETQPFKIFLKDHNQNVVNVKGKRVVSEKIKIKRNSNVIRGITGIESESYLGHDNYLKTIEGTITTNKEPFETWQLYFENTDSYNFSPNNLIYLTSKNRKIDISVIKKTDNLNIGDSDNCQSLVFMEKDTCIAKVCGLRINFNPIVDIKTKNIIIATVIALDN